jgi:hypothetical protein
MVPRDVRIRGGSPKGVLRQLAPSDMIESDGVWPHRAVPDHLPLAPEASP